MGPTTSLSTEVFLDVAKTHVMMICGKRGCLTGNTKIFTDQGFKDIRDFDENKDLVLSFNTEKRDFEFEKAKLLRYPIKDENLVKVEFSDGKTITMTKEHPLLFSNNKTLLWKDASELDYRDTIVSVTSVPEVKNDKESVRIARLLGFLLADGTMNIRKGEFIDGRGYKYNGKKARLRIFNACDEVLKIAKDDLEKEFKITAKRYKRKDCNCEVIESKHQKVIKKFNELGVPLGKKAGIIRVPTIVFESSNRFKSNFVSALFCCDGFIPEDGREAEYDSKSKEFLSDLQMILKHFDIESVIRKRFSKANGKTFESYRLFISDNHSIKNLQKIGIFSKFKHKRLMNHKFGPVPRRKNTDYLSKNLVCSKIKDISYINGINEVFDLQVPKNNSFIANGIISHNSGKSYSASVIAEEIARMPEEVKKNLTVLFFDTMGIFWTMRYPNTRQEKHLEKWQLRPEGMKINIFTPEGYYEEYKQKGIPTDFPFAIRTSELDAGDWCNVFDVKITDPIGVLIERVTTQLKEHKKDFSIDDVIDAVNNDKKSTQDVKNAVENRFFAANKWGLFAEYGTTIEELMKPGSVNVLDISCYTQTSGDWSTKGLVIGIVCKKLLAERIAARKSEEMQDIESSHSFFSEETKQDKPMVWIMIDEAHEFLPKEGKTPATDALVQLLREGRQPGISLVLVTQQPGEIHKDVLTQSDIILSHKLTSSMDIQALNSMMQTYLTSDIASYLNNLPNAKGGAILLDDNSERIYPMRVHPKRSWHGGEAPSALKIKKEVEFDF